MNDPFFWLMFASSVVGWILMVITARKNYFLRQRVYRLESALVAHVEENPSQQDQIIARNCAEKWQRPGIQD